MDREVPALLHSVDAGLLVAIYMLGTRVDVDLGTGYAMGDQSVARLLTDFYNGL